MYHRYAKYESDKSHAKLQKIALPSLFKPSTGRLGTAAKASILRDPPAVLTRKRSTALPPPDISQNTPEKWKLGRPPKKRAIEPMDNITRSNRR